MNPRPKNTDTMGDVLKMQNDYLKQKNDANFKPAAETIKVSTEPKQSVFAKRRNLKPTENNDKDLKSSEVIGNVLERKYENPMEVDDKTELKVDDDKGFPKPKPIDVRSFVGKKGKSIFSQMIKKQKEKEPMDEESSIATTADINEENLQTLNGMTQEEILEEQAKLLKTMDPKLVEFVRSKRKSNEAQSATSKNLGMNPSSPKVTKLPNPADMPALDFLKDEQAKNWLHFDILEPEKLEWTRNIEKTFANLKPGETYEARFDWKGFLLPFIDNEVVQKDDRELYLHGEDPHRPGYSLQELFRLARATVLQQRIAAINAIAGIINIYNQGYYDGILDLPISKIFFFLRFALDENTPAIVEVSSRALSFLFYNDTDETLLDIAYETREGLRQPILDNKKAAVAGTGGDEVEADLESSLKNLSLDEGRKLFESKVEDLVDDNDERESVNDFHLAEVNLVECLMRTNIIERISYILTVTKPNEVTIQSCVKILIRLARSSREFALRILNKSNLIDHMITEFLPSIEGNQEPHFIVLKLFRVLSSYDRSFCLKLANNQVVEITKSFVCTRKDVNVNLLKLQIESFRFLRLYFFLFLDESTFKDLIMPIRYLLEWHFQHLDFQRDNHFIIRQHASALLYLLGSGNLVVTFPIFSEPFKMCCSKWFAMAMRGGAKEFSQKMLMSTLLDVGGPFVSFASEFFYDFIDDYLLKFLNSTHYQQITRNLCSSTPLFKSGEDRCNVYKPLINLGSIVRRHKKSAPTLVLSQDYSVYLLDSLLGFIDAFDNMNSARNHDYHHKLCDVFFREDVEKYFRDFCVLLNRSLSTNWFLKTEINFIFKLLTARTLQFNDCLQKVAFNLLNCLTQENLEKIFFIFHNYIFNERFYFGTDVKSEEYLRWECIYNGLVLSKVKENMPTKKTAAIAENWNQIMLNESWPYSLLLILLYNAEIDTDKTKVVETELTEIEIIMTTLKFTHLLDRNKVQLISVNQQLMYLMVVYFGKNCNFLESPVKHLISEKLKLMKNFSFPPKFNMKLNKEKSFESLYTMFLDTFQSESYGDEVFSVLVMVPLAQKYDVKWRKLVWSEYVMTMKFISCREEDLLESFNEYLYPIETDESLLKCYRIALSSKILKQNSLPWRIAEHHLKNARKF